MKEEKLTLIEMLLGIIISTTVLMLIGSLIVQKKAPFALGILFGGAVAVIVLIQLYYSLNKTLDLDSESAKSYSVRHAILRLMIMGAALVVGIVFYHALDILGILLGLLSLKFSAFLQPVIHKLIAQKYLQKGR